MNKAGMKSNAFQKHSGMSLPEVIVTLLILGVLAAVLFPVISKAKPDENEMMHKKATFILERVVSELVTDEFLYPKNSEIAGLGNLSTVTVNGKNHGGWTKFCSLFGSRINRVANSEINCDEGAKSVTSAEGIDWYLPISDFRNNEFEIVKVDVNGAKGPNCQYDKDNCKRPDQFTYQVRGGTRIPTKVVGNLDPTAPPPAKPVMPGAPDNPPPNREGLKWWSITCRVFGSGTVLGVGENKPNGHYQLVALPKPGHVGTWFTKNVTVKDANFTNCDVTFNPIDKCMIPGVCDGNPDTPVVPPDPPKPPTPGDKEKTYCINKVVAGDAAGCSILGTNPKECGLSSGTHNLTATVKEGYEGSWKDNKHTVTIVDKDVTATLNCNKKEEEEKCYNITAKITGMCSVSGTGCKKPGTYTINIAPASGWTTTTTSQQVILGEADQVVAVTCTEAAPPPEKDPDACCETKYGKGAKFIKSQNKCVKDFGKVVNEVHCPSEPKYCFGQYSGFKYDLVWSYAYKTCDQAGMKMPNISELNSLLKARSSVFANSGTTNDGYWSTTERSAAQINREESHTTTCDNYRYQIVPEDGIVHSACPSHIRFAAMCVGSAPDICSTTPGPDSGADNGFVSIKLDSVQNDNHYDTANYTVNWSGVSGVRKFRVAASSIVYFTDFYYTYYGVTKGASGSYSGTVTGIPKYVKSKIIMIRVYNE